MKRKIIKQGVGGYTLYLPKAWVMKNNLDAGDELDVREEQGNLIIGGKGNLKKRKTISVEHLDSGLLRSLLASYYRSGYAEVELDFQEDYSFESLKRIIDTFIGYEIIHQDRRKCLIRDIMKEDADDSAEKLVNRLFQSVNLLYDLLKENIKARRESFKNLSEVRQNVIRLRYYAQRRTIIEGREISYELYSLALSVEKIGSIYARILGPNTKLSPKSIPLLEKYHRYFTDLHKWYLSEDPQNNAILVALRSEINKDFESGTFDTLILSRKYDPIAVMSCARTLHFLYSMATRIQAIHSLRTKH